MERADCIFLHVPKLTNANRPLGRFTAINFLPMGLLALADRLHRSGLSTQVVHLGIEWIEDKTFSILSYLREKNPRIVALDLHWHHQSYDVIETVKQIKAAFPQTYILLGGITASFFHQSPVGKRRIPIRGRRLCDLSHLVGKVKGLVGRGA